MALVEGTSALAVGALGAYMTSTGVQLTVIQGGAAAAETAMSSAIAGYAAANGTTAAAASAAITGGLTITPAGVIVLTAAAVAILAGVVAWIIANNEVEPEGGQKTVYSETGPKVLINGKLYTCPGAADSSLYWRDLYGSASSGTRLEVRWRDYPYGESGSLIGSWDPRPYKITLPQLEVGESKVAFTFDEYNSDCVVSRPAENYYSHSFVDKTTGADLRGGWTLSAAAYQNQETSFFVLIYLNTEFKHNVQKNSGFGLAQVNINTETGLLKDYYTNVSSSSANNRSIRVYTPTELPQITTDEAAVSIPSAVRYEIPEVAPNQIIEITLPNTVETPTLDNLGEVVTGGLADGDINPDTVPLPNIESQLQPQPNPNPDPQPVPVPDPAPVIDSDPVQVPALPIIGSGDSGMIQLWNPTKAEMETLSNYLLSGDFIDNVLKLFRDPADYLLSLSLMPVTPAVSTNKMQPYIGNIAIPGLTMYAVTDQYADIDCGSVTIPAKYGSFLDYDSQISIFVPFCGEMALNTADVIGSTLSLKYRVDLLTGTCTAMLRVQRSANGVDLDAVLYQWQGNIAAQLPIRASTWSVGITDVAAGAIAGATAGPVGALVGGAAALGRGMVTPRISGSGSLTGNAGHLGVQVPYIIITTPRPATPSTYVEYAGRAEDEVVSLSTLSGYNQIADIHLEGITATRAELAEIDELLKGGVIF